MWVGGKAIYDRGEQIAEIVQSLGYYHIRNLRKNGTVGIAFSTTEKTALRPWLDNNYPGWTTVVPPAPEPKHA